MNESWPAISLGEVATIRTGKLDSNAAIVGGRYPFFTCSPETLAIDTYAFDDEAVLLAGNNANGVFSVKHYHGKFNAYQRTYVITSQDGSSLSTRFLYYQLKYLAGGFTALSIGSATKFLTLKILSPLQLSLPSIEEQRTIAAVLGSLDDKIAQNRRTGRKLEELARAVFKAWFVDFEPVKAKAAGAAAFPGMPHDTFATIPKTLKDSPLGPVPEGWEVGKLGDNSDINKSSIKAGGIEGEIEYVDIASVSVGQLSAVMRVNFADAPGRARRCVHHGDTIWSCVRPNRRSHLFVHSPPANRIASTGFAVISPKILGAAYIYEATTRQEFVDYLIANADGSAYPAVRAEHFACADVLVPAQPAREAFEETAMPLRDLIASGHRESAKLATLRDYLLPHLLSGRVRVVREEQSYSE